MARSGRPQGAPKGSTEAANELARFLRELTGQLSIRELAERYPKQGSKTLWGEYRSGARIIPLGRLNMVVKDQVRDARGRQAMLAKARRLYEEAMVAEAEGRPAPGLDEALAQAEKDVADMGRVVKVLLAKIDTLEQGATSGGAAGGEPGAAPDSVVAELEQLRLQVSEARQIQEATRQAYTDAQETAQEAAPDELVVDLVHLHDSVTRHHDTLLEWDEDDTETAKAQAPEPAVPASDLVPKADAADTAAEPDEGSTADDVAKPVEAAKPEDEPNPDSPPNSTRSPGVKLAGTAVLLLVAVSVAGGIVIGLDRDSSTSGHPDTDLKQPSASASPSVTTGGPGLGLNPPGASSSAPPADGPGERPGSSAKPPGPSASGSRGSGSSATQVAGTVYTVTADRSQVMKWTADSGWTVAGGVAGKVYAGPAGLFATDPKTGDIFARNGTTGDWKWIGSPGAQFLVHGTSLYALTPRKDAVMRWTGEGAAWENIGGPATRLYAGGAGLFATFPDKNNDLYRYEGPAQGWKYAGGPGADFAIGPDYIAGLAPNLSQIWMADARGNGWHRISDEARGVVAGGAGLFATMPDGKLAKYDGTPGSWTPVGAAGTAHDVDARSLYRIARGSGAVERWTGGTTWTPLGRTASDLNAG
ncbi:hypothetical protein [Streptomyces sp. NPDC050848]|uniref:hypothetical protein n=1 Tax=Streptomyces sp. NPDC050848 TaxID=3155791 RepID=UPI0033CEB1E6